MHSTLATLCLPHTLLASGSPESSAYLQVCFNLSVWSSRRSIFLLIDVSAPRSQLLIWCVQRCHDSMHFIWTYPSLRQPRAPKLSLVFLFFYILKKSVADSGVYESAVKLQKCFMDCKTILNFFHLVLFWLWDEWIMTEFSFLDNCSIFLWCVIKTEWLFKQYVYFTRSVRSKVFPKCVFCKVYVPVSHNSRYDLFKRSGRVERTVTFSASQTNKQPRGW